MMTATQKGGQTVDVPETRKVTVHDFVDQVQSQVAFARKLGYVPQYLVIHPRILFELSADKEFHNLQEFSLSRIVQDSPKLRFMRIDDDLVLTLMEKRHEFMFHLE
jgi:hypothetical protein